MIEGELPFGRIQRIMENLKKILIVDDSEIDREILKSIFEDEFEVIEADNGYSALEIIMKEKERIDAVFLDVSMPVLDGLNVLRLMRENDFDDVPVFMITAEATKDNIEKASQYKISEFIKKPFDRDEILRRLRLNLGVAAKQELRERDVSETRRYISDLESVYDRYLMFSGQDKRRDERRYDLMKILLQRSPNVSKETELDRFKVELISKAAYLCNIGNMLVPDILSEGQKDNEKDGSDANTEHTIFGAELIRLNYSKYCRYFVQICSDMCLHHHERYDGTGFPHGISGSNNAAYTQLCGLVDRFDRQFFNYNEHNSIQFDLVISNLAKDVGAFGDNVFALLKDSKNDIIRYYQENYL